MSSPLLDVRHLTVRRGARIVVEDVTCQFQSGELVSVVGPNGAGKSTFVRALLGLIPSDGEVLVRGVRLARRSGEWGYIPQSFAIDPDFPMTVEEFLFYGGRPPFFWWWRRGAAHERGREYLRRLDAEELIDRPLGALSGGELQRVLLAQALLRQPAILILDEPSTGLDVNAQHRFHEVLRETSQREGILILLVTHDLDMVFEHSNSVLCLNRRMMCLGTPEQAQSEEVLGATFGTGMTRFRHNHDNDHHHH